MSKKSCVPKIASRCETCHGAGVLPGRCREDELVPCPTCKGKGVIPHKVITKRVEEMPCDNPNCHEGRVQQIQMVDGREVVIEKACPVCEGYGVMYREYEEITTENEKCPTCEGRAMITAGEMRRRKLEAFCPDCHGTGYKLEEEPAKRAAMLGAFTFLYPAVAVVSMGFKFMLRSVKAAFSARKSKSKDVPETEEQQ